MPLDTMVQEAFDNTPAVRAPAGVRAPLMRHVERDEANIAEAMHELLAGK